MTAPRVGPRARVRRRPAAAGPAQNSRSRPFLVDPVHPAAGVGHNTSKSRPERRNPRSRPDRPKPGGAVEAGRVADEDGPLAGMLKARALAPPPAAASVKRRPYSMRDPVTIKCPSTGRRARMASSSPLRCPATPPGAALSRSCGLVLVPPSGRCASCASTACPRRCAEFRLAGAARFAAPLLLARDGTAPSLPSPRPRPSKAGARLAGSFVPPHRCLVGCAPPALRRRDRLLALSPLPPSPFPHAGDELAYRTAPTRKRRQC